MKLNLVGGLCLCMSLLIAWPSAPRRRDPLVEWNAGKAAIAACLAPTGNALAESRMYAMVHVAMHDALNAIDRQSRPYAFEAQVTGRTSRHAALASAARDVLVSVLSQLQETAQCIQNGIASVEADYAQRSR